jgi:tetratricopeptide (TPR) repeat protein
MRKYIRILLIFFISVIYCANEASAQNDRQLIRQGNRLYHQEKYDKAEVEYRKAVSKNPQNSQAFYNLGCALMMQQKDSAAIVQYQNAGKMETNKIRKAKVYHNIGVVCQKHQMFGDAIKAYEESLRNNPNDNETRYNLALCKRQQKNQKQKGGGGDNKKNNKNKNNKDKQNKNQKNDKNKDQNKQEKQPKEQMSKENAEQLLNAAVQEEKATQQRLKKAMQMPRRKQLQEEW